MKKLRRGSLLLLGGLLILAAGCQQQPPDTRAADEAALRARDAEWSKVTGAKDAAAFASFFADGGVIMPPNGPALTDRAAIEKWAAELTANPGFAVSWTVTQVEVARSGDLGYTRGTYELTLNDAKGKPMTEKGKYVTAWKKQADGTWKVVADIFNAGQ